MKPKREITLGEMQDECKRINGTCVGLAFVTEDCKYKGVCPFQMQSRKALAWDLTDPPRFTEAQMAFWKSLYDLGARKITACSNDDDISCGWETNDMNDHAWYCISISDEMSETIGLEVGETLDLAELFGKDGA